MNTWATAIALILLGLPIVSVLLLGYQLLRNGQGIVGKPSINPFFFYSAKLLLVVLFAGSLYGILGKGAQPVFMGTVDNEVPSVLLVFALCCLVAGNLFLLPALLHLGIFTRVGIPEGEHALQTNGIYRISRNPMYLSFYPFFVGMLLLVPNLVLMALSVYVLATHHLVILSEEKFLEKAFGQRYSDYQQSTPRYI